MVDCNKIYISPAHIHHKLDSYCISTAPYMPLTTGALQQLYSYIGSREEVDTGNRVYLGKVQLPSQYTR